MKKRLLVSVLLLIAASLPAQNTIDYTTYDVIAKASNVTVLVKDNDYRMVVGSLKKSKATFLLGYSTEQASQKLERLLDIICNDNYSKADRQISFCGIGFHYTVKDDGRNERYCFVKDGDRVRFELSKSDVLLFRDTLRE